jgi:hypothetical protein
VLHRRSAAAVLERGVVAQFDDATFAWKQVRRHLPGSWQLTEP